MPTKQSKGQGGILLILRKALTDMISNTTEFIEKARKIHGDKYDYSISDYVNSRIKVKIICSIHGSFLQMPPSHLSNRGCPKCGIEKRNNFNRSNTETFIKKAIEGHKDKYDYSQVDYKAVLSKVIIICKKHGKFHQKPNVHLNGGGCPECGVEKLGASVMLSKEEFVKKSSQVHKNKYDYSKSDYINTSTKIIITCPIHGDFLQFPSYHMTGRGCQICRTSKGELKVLHFLKENQIPYTTQKMFDDCINPKTNKRLKFDFYIPSKNLLIEYDGPQHYRCGRVGTHIISQEDLAYTQHKDKIKTLYAKSKGIKLIRIKYTQFKQIEKILRRFDIYNRRGSM